MTARPAPRRSSLHGASPVAPAQPVTVPPAAVQVETAIPRAAAPVAPRQKPAGDTARPATKYPPKVSFYQDPEDTARVRGAILHTMTTEGSRNLSQFIHHAVMAEVERLEEKYNGGQPFPPIPARGLPQGRPMGE